MTTSNHAASQPFQLGMTTIDIDGWLFPDEALLLNSLAADVRAGVIVEIGSYRGRSTVMLAYPRTAPVYTIDARLPADSEPFGDIDREVFMANILNYGVARIVRPIELPSADVAKVWKLPIGLLFIDGAHSYENVKADLEGFLPHVLEGGMVAFHDSNQPSVIQTIAETPSLVPYKSASILSVYRKAGS